ncbi:glycerophosphodiester phosphodiesterase family protein [Campylobacter upsaliensis]|uniref:glycerophosphodiester phosphodiesterase family protein n=1 Tax=Campylobacter upsaliensis TaxID=28080 RepID=UPI0022EAD2BF|nr:glycerophosphodiester phosphodiesterase family protein [Campylobacter upsaliensis]ELS3708001.1 hypothetical protein [Campylobacter upsaliensis]MEB2804008.1 glycerophosphodiester phosphodiesterase family protein [Campylobacter upsaliensis]MEB2812198.1 glycerophosphodiester phosphodiesterase family protein [Campylobacter upsaliensis]MEB2823227.1 glycerophosphodiester phosphodiesterase family protein [Campylobacter upsaliensis]
MKIVLYVLMLALTLSANPLLVAHRAGTADAPENTLAAIKLALKNKADVIWISVQLSKDKKFVLYRPSDLSALTDKQGKISQFDAKQLQSIHITKSPANKAIYSNDKLYIPLLEEVLKQFPRTQFYIDLKSPDANDKEQAKILLELLKKTKSLDRVRLYSTEDNYILALSKEIPSFATRGATRKKLADVSLTHFCKAEEQENVYYGLELERAVKVVEKFTLGEGVSETTLTWDNEAMECFGQNEGKVILFGINTPQAYEKAKALKADGVMVDSPSLFKDR